MRTSSFGEFNFIKFDISTEFNALKIVVILAFFDTRRGSLVIAHMNIGTSQSKYY